MEFPTSKKDEEKKQRIKYIFKTKTKTNSQNL